MVMSRLSKVTTSVSGSPARHVEKRMPLRPRPVEPVVTGQPARDGVPAVVVFRDRGRPAGEPDAADFLAVLLAGGKQVVLAVVAQERERARSLAHVHEHLRVGVGHRVDERLEELDLVPVAEAREIGQHVNRAQLVEIAHHLDALVGHVVVAQEGAVVLDPVAFPVRDLPLFIHVNQMDVAIETTAVGRHSRNRAPARRGRRTRRRGPA